MANNGDNLTIGGFKDLSLTATGYAGSDIASVKQTLPESDYNTFRTNKPNNQNLIFGSLVAQHTTTGFNSKNIDYIYGSTSGLNPFNGSKQKGETLTLIG